MKYLEKVYEKQGEKVVRLTVGPVPCHPEMLKILGQQFFSTRDKFFIEIMKYLQGFLQDSVGTAINFVMLEHGSGSSGLCSIANHLLRKSDKVLCLDTGKFGERWVKIAKTRQCAVIEMKVPWEEAVNWQEVGKMLKKEQPFALFMQHSETSTGAVHSLAEAHNAIKTNSPATLLVVDAISSWGSIAIEMDKNEIDVVIGSSQKGFMLPTGLHFLAFSERALQRIAENKKLGEITDFSHNPIADIEGQKKGEPRFSMDSNSLMALVYLKEEIIEKAGGWAVWFKQCADKAQKVRKAVLELGLPILSKSAGDVVTAIVLNEKYDVADIRSKLKNYGFEVNKSQDEAKFKGIRIGNMGYITDKNIADLISALQEIFKN